MNDTIRPRVLGLFYDTETQHLPVFSERSDDPRQPHIVQLGAVLVDMDTREILDGLDVIVRPDGWTIPSETTAIHGITTEYALEHGKQRLALLRAACRWGWKKHNMCEADPTTRMQLPAVSNERHVYIGREEIGRLVRAADRKDVRAMILAAFYTGMRLGELFIVEARDGALVLADTKNGTRRVIPAHPRVKPLLRYLPLAASRNTLTRGWERARRAAGLEHVHFHDLRHSAASEMVNAGVDLFTVGRVLGHKDQRSTARYSHHRDETLAAAVGKIGQKSPHKDGPGKKKATG